MASWWKSACLRALHGELVKGLWEDRTVFRNSDVNILSLCLLPELVTGWLRMELDPPFVSYLISDKAGYISTPVLSSPK